jgi:hypothetical protein
MLTLRRLQGMMIGLTALATACGSSPATADASVDAGHDGASDAAGDAPRWSGAASATDGVARVLLVSIDGFHGADLERYIAASPGSTLARLAAVGVRYPNATAPFPSDSFPSVLAWATGGSPRTTGVYYDVSYDRALSPPGSDCSTRGTVVDFSDAADINNNVGDGGGGLNLAALPRDPANGCAVVRPHDYLRVNTIFEVAKSAGLRTAWSDKHLSYEILNGPSGAGVDDLYDPEVAAFSDGVAYDHLKVMALLNEIAGRDHAGGTAAGVPALFGMNFQAVSMAQKASGYADAAGTPTAPLASAIDAVDQSLGTLVDALNAAGLWSTTLFVVAASHGQSPVDPTLLARYPTALVPSLANEVQPGIVAAATQDAVALLWLADPAKGPAVAQHLTDVKATAGIDRIVAGDPATDPRAPDLFVIVRPGTIYTDSHKKVAEHGGFSDDDRKVALLVAGRSAGEAVVTEAVETKQLAPTLIGALGLDASALQAVASEQTAPLPGLTLAP